ncbi:O-antigen ligase family protein [Pikeienuella sp. HZG-20]|uniref:O-antigen ligase family protein n=1 Tax=Paludibacillus litoralis TaxID=3133267 RepID=UPI0030EC17E5
MTTRSLHPLMKIALVSLLIPVQFYVGSLLLTPSRIFFLIVTPYLFIQLLSGAYGRLRLSDILTFLFFIWFTISMIVNNFNQALTFVGLHATLLFGGYLVGRASIRSLADFQAFVRFYVLTIVLMLPFAVYESITSQFVIAEFIRSLGLQSFADVNYERRLGLDRAQVVFTHPIHFGLYCSLGFALYFVTFRRSISLLRRALVSGLVAFTAFFSVSSGAVLALVIQMALIGYDHMFRNMKNKWLRLIGCGVALYVILDLLSDRPAYLAIITRVSLNVGTAYYRQNLLEYGLAQIARTPIFGVGYNRWELPHWMSDSIDNFWLMTALVYGVPAFVFFAGLFLNIMFRAARHARPGGQLHDARVAYNIMLVSISFTLATVAIWGELLSVAFMIFGASGFFFDVADEETAKAAPPAPARRRAVIGDMSPESEAAAREGGAPTAAKKRTVL